MTQRAIHGPHGPDDAELAVLPTTIESAPGSPRVMRYP